ncbi:tripartite tricarboxylate transporter TctB family protein [Enterobacteriaceae bacterium H11S18]|uniref:tripartite tricarboxylate transporter TctB family protein n=1 Tax=Dryocola clanedunensis TaxID=2925396 RepID=UPI0022F01F96|nr:tripartite tricarboxylate transporter TctB family protein [Dryocola clanedunensis]MCT4706685.1 tripartite tricarboxylate transporter TctB family protein [Dryocola clanedunensis]MCT4712212.1 tripartite tricarboxylate transporter TctB family protein [Dryocola clanedunensis]
MRLHYIIPVLFSVLALVWIYTAIELYGLWDEGPAGGFMPTIAASVLLIFSIMSLCKTEHSIISHHIAELTPVAIVIAMLGITQLTGMIPAIMIVLLGWVKYIADYSWRKSISISAGVTLMIWLIFSQWLNVPFPTGLV